MTKLDDVLQLPALQHYTITTIQQNQTHHISLLETQPPPSILPSTPTLPSSYPIKCLTYSEMQQLRDQGLCLSCNDIDTLSHRCPVKRILLVLPDKDPNIEQQSMEIHAPEISVAAAASPKSHKSPPTLAVATRSISRPSPTPPPMNSPPRYPIFVPTTNNVHYQSDAYYSTAAVYKALCAILAQNSSWHIAQKENGAHNVFVEMNKLELEWADTPNISAEMNKLKYERKILIFDPGGDIFNATCFFAIWSKYAGYNINGHGNKMFNKFDRCISDLEDKVDLEGVGVDTATSDTPTQEDNAHINARTRRAIQRPQRYLD